MNTKSKPKMKLVRDADLTAKEVDAWTAANRTAINKDLAEARKGLRAGQGREWNFTKFVARAKKRSPAKKK